MAEMALRRPLIRSRSDRKRQLKEILKILGSDYENDFIDRVFFELLNLVLVQDPKIRVTASEALDHTYFRDLDK